jgi:hypothetical protein
MIDPKMIPAPTDDQPDFDKRLQERYVTKGHWLFEKITQHTDTLSELVEVVELGPPQPAIGSFSEEYLAQVQKNFPYLK